MKKKLLSVLLVGAMAFSLAACGGGSDDGSSGSGDSGSDEGGSSGGDKLVVGVGIGMGDD